MNRRPGKYLALSFVGLTLTLSVAAHAGGHGCKHKGQSRPAFTEIDLDADGFVTEKEFSDFRAKRMAARGEEGRKLKNASKAPSFSDMDIDGDGKVSPDEFAAHRKNCKRPCASKG